MAETDCKSTPNPDYHFGPIIAQPFAGRRHWVCLACEASVSPPPDGKARLSKKDLAVLAKLRPAESE
jgi:hypothetical protein